MESLFVKYCIYLEQSALGITWEGMTLIFMV